MDLINTQAAHRVFGTGHVTSVENGHITIEFDKTATKKTFCYPGVFEHHLTMSDPAMQQFVASELQISLNLAAVQLKQKQQEMEEKIANHIVEKKAASKSAVKKAAPKTTAAKVIKPATKKVKPVADE